ncbi:hypothetical protein, partial [Mesorhizobium sp. M7A.F.Ca.CA.001.04.1.1]|uniref:hypothetical protein n=1 Tax=Mesorhizobium sp. M7A.F.Ca.CA.001.04.1.1 TaxID=2496714 RepID=UPI0019CFD644
NVSYRCSDAISCWSASGPGAAGVESRKLAQIQLDRPLGLLRKAQTLLHCPLDRRSRYRPSPCELSYAKGTCAFVKRSPGKRCGEVRRHDHEENGWVEFQ